MDNYSYLYNQFKKDVERYAKKPSTSSDVGSSTIWIYIIPIAIAVTFFYFIFR